MVPLRQGQDLAVTWIKKGVIDFRVPPPVLTWTVISPVSDPSWHSCAARQGLRGDWRTNLPPRLQVRAQRGLRG